MAASSISPSPSVDPLQFIERLTRDAALEQENVLTQILAQNADTEYLRAFGTSMDSETFRSKVPMVTYDDIKPLIRRIADGDRSPILCAHPISEFLWSSGTSGEPKMIPSTEKVLDRNSFVYCSFTDVINMHVKGLDKGKCLSFSFIKPDNKTPGGTPIRVATSSIYKTDAFNKRWASSTHTSPIEAIYCDDNFQSMYTQMLCGLYHCREINRIDTIFASGLVRLIKFLRLNWQQLTQDIRTGSLNPKVTNTSICECMSRILKPNAEIADHIGRECAKDEWEGIITRIWPNTKILSTIATGTMAQNIPTLDYYSGGLPIVSMVYASSECFSGLNLNPMSKPPQVSYTIMPNMAYFEFLPLVTSVDFPEPSHSELVRLVDVEIGKEYEIVVTTDAGLYRYRVGDILRATGFYNASPQFEFIGRKKVVLNIEWEMTTETELQAAIENASRLLLQFNESVMDYTSFVDTTSNPDHYVICLELLQEKGTPSDEVLEKCCLVMEESLNWVYRRLRVSDGLIGPLEIRVMKNGTFGDMMDCAISGGGSMSQYKTPRSVMSKTMLDLLDSRVVSRHFSPSFPRLSGS